MAEPVKPSENRSDELRELCDRCEDLERQLVDAENLLDAIRRGEVDALVVSTDQGERVFTLRDADYTYRVMVETMQEGAATLLPDGVFLYANTRLAEMLGYPLEQLIGSSILSLTSPENHDRMVQLLAEAGREVLRDEVEILRSDSTPIPVHLSATPLSVKGVEAICLVLTDLSETKSYQRMTRELSDEVERRRVINQELEQRVRERTEELRRLAGHVEAVREEEGRRIAQEIHDQIGGGLTAMKIDLSLIRRALGNEKKEICSKIDALNSLLTEIVGDVRRISRDLRPPVLDQLGLNAAIQHHLSEFEERTRVHCSLELESIEPVNSAVAMPIFRIIQESLTNVAKHAQATEVTVRSYVENGVFCLEVADNGRGFDRSELRGNTVGLIGMKERAVRVGGQLRITTKNPTGTVVRLTIPCDSIVLREPLF